MLTEKQIAVVTDAAADGPNMEYLGSPIDILAPIDLDKLREATTTLGPLRMRSASSPYSVEITVTDCACGCGTPVINVLRRNGVFSIRWILDKEDLLQFGSLEHFKDNVLAGALRDTSGERQFIERQIQQTFEAHYSEVEPHVCICEACAEHIGKDALWRKMLLSQLATNLGDRDDDIGFARKTFADFVAKVASESRTAPVMTRAQKKAAREAVGDVIEGFVKAAFDLGYQTGRLYSEFQVKDGIEEHALAGMQFEDTIAKRAHSGGKASTEKRMKRMTSLVDCIERLAADNPAVVKFGPQQVARVACEEAVANDPALWSQGAGQVEEYLGQIRRGEAGDELKARYFALFPAQPKHSHKTA